MKSFVYKMLTGTLFAVAIFAMPPTEAANRAETESETIARALLSKYVVLKNTKDLTKMNEIYSADYIENSGRNPSGIEAVTKNWAGQFAGIPDLKVIVHDVIVSGDKIVARVTYTGTHTVPFFAGIAPTGRTIQLGTIDIWRVADGKFVEHWDQVDFAGLQRQLTTPIAAKP
jgi:predicted ester cyclase